MNLEQSKTEDYFDLFKNDIKELFDYEKKKDNSMVNKHGFGAEISYDKISIYRASRTNVSFIMWREKFWNNDPRILEFLMNRLPKYTEYFRGNKTFSLDSKSMEYWEQLEFGSE